MQKYAAKYTMVGTPTGNCAGKIPTAELVNMQYYRTKPNDNSVAPSLAIEPQSVFDAVTAANEGDAAGHGRYGSTKEYAIGSFAGYEPDDNDLCRAATLSESTVTIGGRRSAATSGATSSSSPSR